MMVAMMDDDGVFHLTRSAMALVIFSWQIN